jgi:hypothetical protein
MYKNDELFKDSSLNLKYSDSCDTAFDKSDGTVIFSYLVGSQNYGLSTSESDVDIKVFAFPTTKALYEGLRHGTQAKVIDCKYGQAEIHDFRDIPVLLKKMNPTYLEMFFTTMTFVDPDFSYPMSEVEKLLPRLFNENLGIFKSSIEGTFWTRLRVMAAHIDDQPEDKLFRKSAALCARMLCYNAIVIADPLKSKDAVDRSAAFDKALHMRGPECEAFLNAAKSFKIDNDLIKGVSFLNDGLRQDPKPSLPMVGTKSDKQYVLDYLTSIGTAEFDIGKNIPSGQVISPGETELASAEIDRLMFEYFEWEVKWCDQYSDYGLPYDDDELDDDDYDDDSSDDALSETEETVDVPGDAKNE